MAHAAEAGPLPLPDRRLLARIATLRRGLGSQLDVINALILRETRTRFGRNRLGYLWAVLEPVIVTFTFYAVLTISKRELPPGTGMFGFVATGVLPFTLFSNSVTRVAEAVNGNKPLLYYPQVRPLDLVISRSLLEAATMIAVFALVMGADMLVSQQFEIHSSLLVIAGMAVASALGTSLGLVFCGLGQISPVVDRARGPLTRPLFWVSGIFFTADMLPDSTRQAFLWNPMLHATELMRAGWFENHDATYVDPTYVLWWIGGMTLVGLLFERWVRRRIDLT